MKLIDRYEFTNGKAFETYYLEAADANDLQVPKCDVVGFRKTGEDGKVMSFGVMRPDEALIQAQMLIDAVRRVTEGYSVSDKAVDLSGPAAVEVNGHEL